jgi:hypothetical protein
MRSKCESFLVAAFVFLGSLFPSSSYAADQCLAQFPDSFWAKGNPLNPDLKLNPELVINSAIVELDSTTDLTNVTSVVKAASLDIFYGKNAKVLAGNYWSGTANERAAVQARIGSLVTDTKNIDAFLTKFTVTPTEQVIPFALFDISMNAKPRVLPLKVIFQYAGKNCETRNVVIPTSVDVIPVQFKNLNAPGYLEGAFQEDYKNTFGLLRSSFQDLNDLRDAFKGTVEFLNKTEKSPIRIIKKNGNIVSGVEEIPGNARTRTGTWYSYDGCLVDSSGSNPVNALGKDVKMKPGQSKCKVQLNWRNTRNPSVWFYAEAYMNLEDLSFPIKATITCVKGKTSRKVTAVNPKCPSGYKLKK